METKLELKDFIEMINSKSDQIFQRLERNLSKINIGRANPQLVSYLKVDYYETLTPIGEIAAISVPSPQQLLIKPYDQNITKKIASTIVAHKLDVQLQNEGHQIRLILPELTTQKRQELVKSLKKFDEEAKVEIRQVRQEVNKLVKKEEFSEDEERRILTELQKQIDKKIQEVDKVLSEKSANLMSF